MLASLQRHHLTRQCRSPHVRPHGRHPDWQITLSTPWPPAGSRTKRRPTWGGGRGHTRVRGLTSRRLRKKLNGWRRRTRSRPRSKREKRGRERGRKSRVDFPSRWERGVACPRRTTRTTFLSLSRCYPKDWRPPPGLHSILRGLQGRKEGREAGALILSRMLSSVCRRGREKRPRRPPKERSFARSLTGLFGLGPRFSWALFSFPFSGSRSSSLTAGGPDAL